MPDIAMCQNEKCPFKMKCFRYTAIPTMNGKYQSYADFKPVVAVENGTTTTKCDDFWDNAGRPSRFDVVYIECTNPECNYRGTWHDCKYRNASALNDDKDYTETLMKHTCPYCGKPTIGKRPIKGK